MRVCGLIYPLDDIIPLNQMQSDKQVLVWSWFLINGRTNKYRRGTVVKICDDYWCKKDRYRISQKNEADGMRL